MRKLALVLLFALAAFAQQPQPVTRKYVMIMGANHAGTQVTTVDGANRTVDFEFNDRGRGPKTHTVVTLDEHGVPVSETTTGNDYLKAPVDERITASDGKLHFVNKAEKGDGANDAFYVGMYSPPEEIGLLARALIAHGGRMKLLPAGDATLTKGETVALDDKTKVTRYEISGLGFTPYSVWLDANNEYFGNVDSWASVIREGYESSIPKLLEINQAADRSRGQELAKALAKHPPAIAITNAKLFDSESMQSVPNTIIVIRGNKIVAVGPNVEIPADAKRIDAAGKTVIPGLWDMHVHLGDTDGLLNIASGITSVRDLANDIDYVTGLRKQFADGTLVGPRVLLAGFLDGPGPYAGPTKVLVDNQDEIKKAIDKYASLGYVQIKIYSSIKPELVPFITTYAHSKGMRVSGHIPAFMYADQAVQEGYDEIQHANFLLLNFLRDVKDTRTPARFTSIAERGGSIDLHSEEAKKFFDLLIEHKTVIDPTLATFEPMFVAKPGVMPEAELAIADRMPPQVRREFLTGGLPDAGSEKSVAGYAKMIEFVRELHAHGIRIVAGTDALAGFTLHRELELYAKAGIPNPEILQLATLGAARVMHRDAELGSVAPGKLADLVVIDGDPVANISDVRKVRTIVKGGNVFDAAEVDRELGVLPN
ncbi:MAG TPA: amidohydrolase family protein [Thermoanaerobaculia bacterium]